MLRHGEVIASGATGAAREKSAIYGLVISCLKPRMAGLRELGAEAVYLWGSIVRSDFDPLCSDIDMLLLGAADASDLDAVAQRLSAEIAAENATLTQVNTRALYIYELCGGPIRSRLAHLIDPRILRADCASWWLVCGTRILPAGLRGPEISLTELLHLRCVALAARIERYHAGGDQDGARYILKEAAFVAHVLHELRCGPHDFSFQGLVSHSNRETAETAAAVIALRQNNWRDDECRTAVRVAEALLVTALMKLPATLAVPQ